MDKASALKEIARIPAIRSAKDLGVMMPESRFEIIDYGVMQTVKEHDLAKCLQFFRSSAEARAAPHVRVLIIFGHHDKHMIDYLDYLGKEGVLTDRVILLYKCDHPLNPDLFEKLKKQYHTVAVSDYTKEIRAIAVAEVLLRLCPVLDYAEQSGLPIRPERLTALVVAYRKKIAERN